MFEAFFVVLKGKGIAVTPGEWLSLQEALDKGLCGCSLSDFYMLSRMLLVKRETDYDRFDLAFGEFFQGIEKGTALSSRLLEWLDKPEMNELLQEKRSEGAFSLERREERGGNRGPSGKEAEGADQRAQWRKLLGGNYGPFFFREYRRQRGRYPGGWRIGASVSFCRHGRA